MFFLGFCLTLNKYEVGRFIRRLDMKWLGSCVLRVSKSSMVLVGRLENHHCADPLRVNEMQDRGWDMQMTGRACAGGRSPGGYGGRRNRQIGRSLVVENVGAMGM